MTLIDFLKLLNELCDNTLESLKAEQAEIAKNKTEPPQPVQSGDRIQVTDSRGSTMMDNEDIFILKHEGTSPGWWTVEENSKIEAVCLPEIGYKVLPYWTEERIKAHTWVNNGNKTMYLAGSVPWWYLWRNDGDTQVYRASTEDITRYLNERGYRHATPEQIQEWVRGEA